MARGLIFVCGLLLTRVAPAGDEASLPRSELVLLRQAGGHDVVGDDDVVAGKCLEPHQGDVVVVWHALDISTMDVDAVNVKPLFSSLVSRSVVLAKNDQYVFDSSPTKQNQGGDRRLASLVIPESVTGFPRAHTNL